MTYLIELWDYDRLLVVLSPTCSACSALKIMEKHEVDDAEFDGAIQWVDRIILYSTNR